MNENLEIQPAADEIGDTVSPSTEHMGHAVGNQIIPALSTPQVDNEEEEDNDEDDDDPAQEIPSAYASISFRITEKLRGGVRVPGEHTGAMLDLATFGTGIGAMVGGPWLIVKLANSSMPSELIIVLCLVEILVVGVLLGMVITRRKK